MRDLQPLRGWRQLRPLVHAACLALCATAPLSLPLQAHAQSAGAATARDYDVAAGALDAALRALAIQAGVPLTFTPEQTAGRRSPGLRGRYTPDAAFAALLAGTDLQAVRQPNGGWALRTVPQAGRAEGSTLAAVTVTAQAERGGASEGTASYVSAAPLSTATPLGLTLKETPQSVSVITQQRMEDQALTSIQQPLAQVPGVTTNTLGTELAGASARGYSFSNYQLDGVNTFVEVLGGGSVPAQTLADMAIYDRVEVLRGASGLVTGSGDPSGTINLVRKKPTAEFQGSVEAGVGSWGEKRGVLDLSGPLNEARSLRGRLIAVGRDGDSYIDNYGRKKGLLYGVLEADLTASTRLTAGLEHEQTKVKGQGSYLGFPLWFDDGTRTDLPRSFSGASRDNRLELKTTRVFAALDQQLSGNWKLKLSADHWRSTQQEDRVTWLPGYTDRNGDGRSLNAVRRDSDTEQTSLDVNLRGPFTLLGREHELVLGAAYEHYKYHLDQRDDTSGLSGTAANLFAWNRTGAGSYGPITLTSDSPMRQSSLYAATRLQLSDKLKLIAGARVFKHDYNWQDRWDGGHYEAPTSESGIFTPYGGLVYDINRIHTAYASYAAIYRPQAARDRDGAVLDPVKGANYEIGLKSGWLDGQLNTAVALYQIRQDNLAESDPGYTVPGNPDQAASRAVKGAKTQGLDAEISGAIRPGWNISASWAYSQTQDANGKRITTSFPRHLIKLWTTYRLPADWSRLTVGGGLNWQSKTYSSVNAWQIDRDVAWEQKAYTVANLMARYEFSPQLSASLNVNNVFDKKYINSASDWWNSGNYGAPRNVALSMKYRF